MDRKLDVTSAETVAGIEPVARPNPPTPAPSSSGAISRVSNSSIPDEGQFVPGTMINGRYRIIGLLGRGGMGEVYRATDLTLGQSVALKFLPQEAAGNIRLLERFHGEVRVARQVSHPNVCRVYDIGEADGMPYISMEYIDGEDLSSLLQRIGRLPADKALETARKICAGLAAAHDKGVIHRDLKPQNIMLNKRGEVVIMDFGLAAVADSLGGAEARNGTPAYMAPEQLKGAEVTAKSDIYALGLVLFELFTGKRPFDAKTIQTLIDQQESQQLTAMTSIASDVDPGVEKAIRRCLHPDPASRPSGARQVAALLPGGDPLAAALAAGETPSPEMVASAGKTEGLERKYSVPMLALVIACLLAIPFIQDRTSAMPNAGMEFSPDVLRQKAREMAASFGYSKKPVDSEFWMAPRGRLIEHLKSLPEPKKWREWLAGEAPLTSWVRESQQELIAGPAGTNVSADYPAPIAPGMTMVEIDGHGRLRNFSGVPYGTESAPAQPVPVEAVFRAAQLPMDKFAEVTPTTLPRSASDQMRAWKGTHPVLPKTDLTVEVAWWKGQVTWVRFVWPWMTSEGRNNQTTPPVASQIAGTLTILMYSVMMLFAILLARRNWRLGRVDKKGAGRIALAQLAIGILTWIGGVHWVPSSKMVSLFLGGISFWLFAAAMMWLLYLALEPALRSRWPYAIVTWNRLLAGKWLDAQVGAHVLIGLAVGVGIWTAIEVRDLFNVAQEGLSTSGAWWPMEGTREWIGFVFSNFANGLQTGLIGFFLMFGLRLLLRRNWIAAIVGAALFSFLQVGAQNPSNWLLSYGIYLVVYGGLIFVLLRSGLVTTIVAVIALNTMNAVVAGSDFTAWYAPASLATMFLLGGSAVFAFWRSLGSRELLNFDTGDQPPASQVAP